MKSIAVRIASIVILTFGLTMLVAAEEPERADPWAPIRVLLGEWEGVGNGFGGESRVHHSYGFILQDNFIHSTTVSEFQPKEDGALGKIHEDWGFFSFYSDRGMIVLRQFLSEGFVTTYVLEDTKPGADVLVFTSESTEGAGGMAARLVIPFEDDDTYRLVLELASPGKDFFECQSLVMERETGY